MTQENQDLCPCSVVVCGLSLYMETEIWDGLPDSKGSEAVTG